MENLQSDIVACWQQLFEDKDIVGPVYVANEQLWRVDMRSRTRRNSFKTSRLGATGLLYQIEIPENIVETMQLEDRIILSNRS